MKCYRKLIGLFGGLLCSLLFCLFGLGSSSVSAYTGVFGPLPNSVTLTILNSNNTSTTRGPTTTPVTIDQQFSPRSQTRNLSWKLNFDGKTPPAAGEKVYFSLTYSSKIETNQAGSIPLFIGGFFGRDNITITNDNIFISDSGNNAIICNTQQGNVCVGYEVTTPFSYKVQHFVNGYIIVPDNWDGTFNITDRSIYNLSTTNTIRVEYTIGSPYVQFYETEQQAINDSIQQQTQQEQQHYDDVQDTFDDAQDAADADSSSSSQQATTSGSTLLQAFIQFVNALTNSSATNCVINADIGDFRMGNVDLCQLDPPPAFQTISSIMVIGFVVPLSLALGRKMISLFRSFQS